VVELRKDPVSGNWVVSGFKTLKISEVGECPFCVGNEHLTPPPIREIRDSDGSWMIRCFPASNPVFVIEAKENKKAEGLYDKMGNVGAHEIIVDHRSHAKTFSTFTGEELDMLLSVYGERVLDLKKDKRFKHIQVFKNHGELAGSYIFHPHSHVLATPVIPQKAEQQLENARSHYLQKERCLFCDIVNQEINQNKRVVSISANFVAFCPFASKFPYETWILPRFHDDRFEGLADGNVRRELADTLLDLVRRTEKLASAYTIIIHTSPNRGKGIFEEADLPVSEYFHWHVEILPRDFRSSKYRREDQFYVVSITPEEAAATLKAQRL
jgi:UDPglucose--hexose-1-phosphate uridylyltransferase